MRQTVFISYSYSDRFFAELLETKLDTNKISAWRDKISLHAGQEWRASIDAGIRDCTALILILSPSAVASHYVTYEWASAMAQGKPIIPVYLDDCVRHPKVEPIQYFDFRSHTESTWETLIQRIQQILNEDESPRSRGTGLNDAPALTSEETALITKVEGYLNGKGLRMISFERMRDKKFTTKSDDELKKLVKRVDRVGLAKLKGPKSGIKLL